MLKWISGSAFYLTKSFNRWLKSIVYSRGVIFWFRTGEPLCLQHRGAIHPSTQLSYSAFSTVKLLYHQLRWVFLSSAQVSLLIFNTGELFWLQQRCDSACTSFYFFKAFKLKFLLWYFGELGTGLYMHEDYFNTNLCHMVWISKI